MAKPPAPNLTLQHITTATLLAAVGGLLDSVVYLDYGHVFANAMTGNVVFLGISVVTRDWAQVGRHLVPLATFLLGVVAARGLCSIPVRDSALLTLGSEIVALLILGFFPAAFPQLAFVAIISFVSAFQVTTFRRVGRFTYSSTFVTGNLREVAEGTFDSLFASDPAIRFLGFAKARKLACICLAFLLGAALGASLAPHFGAHSVWFAEPLLSAVFLLVLLNPPTAQLPLPGPTDRNSIPYTGQPQPAGSLPQKAGTT